MSAHSVSFAPSPAVLSKHLEASQEPTFAFARVQGDICLVQCQYQHPSRDKQGLNTHTVLGQTSVDPSGTHFLDVDIFRHEFASIFRYSHSAHIHPQELRILESLADHAVRYEPDNGTVFLAKDLMAQLKRILDASTILHRTGRRSRQQC